MSGTARMIGLFIALVAIFTIIGYVLGGFFFNDWILGALIFLILAGALNLISYLFAHKIVLWSYRARIVTAQEAPRLYRIVQQAAQFSNMPMPKVAIVPTRTPNAFATGRNPKNAVVAATEGILELLDDRELTGVMAHEMAHVKDRDILVMSVAATVAGAIAFMARIFWWHLILGGRRRSNADIVIALVVAITAPIAAMLVQLAISRSREYKADQVGGRAFGQPEALADALLKLDQGNARRPIQKGNPASASLFIVNPFRGSSFFRLFSTHPPVEERAKRLRKMAREMGRRV